MANPAEDSKKVTGVFIVKVAAVFAVGDNRILLNNNTQSFLQDGNPAFFELIFETPPDNNYRQTIGQEIMVVIKNGITTKMWYLGNEIIKSTETSTTR